MGVLLLPLLVIPPGTSAAIASGIGPNRLHSSEVKAALAKATNSLTSLSTSGGYVWIYSLDLERRAGESECDRAHIWIQAPGTPAVGGSFLRAYAATGERVHLEAARQVAHALARCQLTSGGWHYSADMEHLETNLDGQPDYKGRAHLRLKPSEPINPLHVIATTFDDDNTQCAIRFLLAFDEAVRRAGEELDEIEKACLRKALEGMLRAQYANGAWPEQYDGRHPITPSDPTLRASIPREYPRTWPGAQSYTQSYTLNDNSQRDCILTMLEAWKKSGDSRYLDAGRRGGDFLILAQLPEPQPGWAQQYAFSMTPTWGRVFEPPALTTSETGGALRALVSLHLETGDERYLRPLKPAMAWLERSALGPDLWARFYELGSNHPVFGNTDGKMYSRLDDISQERRSGYGWLGSFGLPKVLTDCRDLLRLGRERFLAFKVASTIRTQGRDQLEASARRVIGELDSQGRWITTGRISRRGALEPVIATTTYIRNVNVLCDWLEASP